MSGVTVGHEAGQYFKVVAFCRTLLYGLHIVLPGSAEQTAAALQGIIQKFPRSRQVAAYRIIQHASVHSASLLAGNIAVLMHVFRPASRQKDGQGDGKYDEPQFLHNADYIVRSQYARPENAANIYRKSDLAKYILRFRGNAGDTVNTRPTT